jgi:hypothetical protein
VADTDTIAREPAGAPARPVWVWPMVVAALIRVPLAFIADDQYGDAPVRFDILDRWLKHPGVWWSWREVYQYGPLPTHLAGLLGLLGFGASGGARILVVTSGIVGCGLVAALAGRVGGRSAGLGAGFALALSSLHIQMSTTFASEAVYVAFALATVWAAWERQLWWVVVFAFCASTTRYDAWLWIPVLALWILTRRDEPLSRRWLTVAFLGAGPFSILMANALSVGDPLHPLQYINGEHLSLVADAKKNWHWSVERWFSFAPWLTWREAMAIYWPAALIGVLTPAFGVAIVYGIVKRLRRPDANVALALGMGGLIPVVYAFRTVVLLTLWPMARFALGPMAFLSIAMPPLRRSVLAACIAIGIAADLGFMVLGDGNPGIGVFAAAMSPVSRYPADLRAGGEALKAVRGPVALDWTPTYEWILIATEAHMYRADVLHPPPDRTPRRVVAISGGEFDAELNRTGQLFGHSYRRTGGEGRVSWWDVETLLPHAQAVR